MMKDEGPVTMSVIFTAAQRAGLQTLADESGLSMGYLIRRAVCEFLWRIESGEILSVTAAKEGRKTLPAGEDE